MNIVNMRDAPYKYPSLTGDMVNSRTTPLMTGAQAVEGMKKVAEVAAVYRPAT